MIDAGVLCLVVEVGLTQDLTLILSTKKHQTKQKTKKNPTKKPNNKNSSTAKWRGIHCEEYRLCATASNNILESAIQEENMLCVTASLIVKKICCALLPTSM